MVLRALEAFISAFILFVSIFIFWASLYWYFDVLRFREFFKEIWKCYEEWKREKRGK